MIRPPVALWPLLLALALCLLLPTSCEGEYFVTPYVTPSPSPSATESIVEGDESLLRSLIDGPEPTAETVNQVLKSIARNGGLPLRSATGGWLFACNCGVGSWNLAGDFNNWIPQAMNNKGPLHWLEIEIDAPEEAGYKFTDGAADWIADPWARRYVYDDNGELSLVRADSAHLERIPCFGPEQGLAERFLRVWVPAGGAFDRILFAHDAQNLFDPEAIWGGWRLQDSLPADVLVAGLDNSADRLEEYTHTQDDIGLGSIGGSGDAYADLVELTVRPYIDEHYGPGDVYGLLGSSLGGLISLHIALRHPGRYDFVASMSGTLGWGRIGLANQTIIEQYQGAGHGATAIYLDSGGAATTCVDSNGDGIWNDNADTADNYCENQQMRDVLTSLGYQFEVDLWHWHEPGASHNETAWGQRVFRPLQIFAGM